MSLNPYALLSYLRTDLNPQAWMHLVFSFSAEFVTLHYGYLGILLLFNPFHQEVPARLQISANFD